MVQEEFAWGKKITCVTCKLRPARFKNNTLCFVCASREEAREMEEKIKEATAETEHEYYEELTYELLDEADEDNRKRY